jgi:predicted methyltransferase
MSKPTTPLSTIKKMTFLFAALALQSCTNASKDITPHTINSQDKQKLLSIAEQLPAEHQARYTARHPVETLAFFNIKPGDTVVEALPGEGWYSKILFPYLGEKGRLIGADYSLTMWPEFGAWATPEFIAERKAWPAQWAVDAKTWGGAKGARGDAYTFADLPEDLTGKVDAVLFIRALHNLARFDAKGNYLKEALAESYRVLKPHGLVGVVQHAISEDKPDTWATGDRGYLKRSSIIKFMTAAGFELIAESDINKNPKDDVQDNENVWRLPPSLNAPDERKAKYQAIGESNRVTLLFRKK